MSFQTYVEENREQLVERMPSRAESRRAHLTFLQNTLGHWQQIHNHAVAEGASYHRVL